jgi:putative phage-type endonuclease
MNYKTATPDAKAEREELLVVVRAGRKRALERELAGALEDSQRRLAGVNEAVAARAARKRPHSMGGDATMQELPPEASEGDWAFAPTTVESTEPPPFLPEGFTFVSDVELLREEGIQATKSPTATTSPEAARVTVGLTGRLTFAVRCITREMQMRIVDAMHIDGPDHVRRICSYAQRTPEWFAARVHRLTGSKAGSAAKMNPYETQDQLLQELLWPTFFGNAACENGIRMEPYAARSLLRIERLKDPEAQLAIPGLIVSEKEPIFAYSADGVVLYADGSRKLIEIKTPVRRKPYPSVPPMYMCQMQLGMKNLGLSSCLFVVYCGRGGEGIDRDTHVTEIPRNEAFIEQFLLPQMRWFFFRRYLPLRVCYELGMLRKNQVYIPHGVKVEYLDQNMFA